MNKKLLILLVLFFTVAFTSAQNTRFSVNSGNWNSTSTWSTTSGGTAGAPIPVAGDIVTIERGRNVTLSSNVACASLQLGGLTANGSGTLTFSTTTVPDPTLTVTGPVQAGGAGNADRDGIITFVSGSTLTADSLTLGNSAGTPGQGTVTMTSNSIMNVGALNVINSGHAWFPSTGTVNMTTTNTLPTSIFTSFNNLTVSAGTTTAGADFSVSGVLNVAATTTLNMAAFAMTGAALNTSGIGTIRTQATATPLPTGRNWSGTVQYDRPAGGQVIMAGTYSNLTLSNTSGTQTASGALTVNGALITTAGCTLNMGTNQLLGTLSTITNGGTIQTQNTTSTPIPTGKIWGGTVQYNGAGQTVMSGTYNNLTLSGSGVKTFAANTVIDNITAIATGVQANLNAITTHTTGALLLNVANQVGGTWGTTTSGATSTNNTFFSGAGRITVPNNAIIDNNFASYSNSTADVFASVGEYTGPLTLTAPNGFVFINTKFASYGTPNGSYPNFTIGSCHAVNSRVITTGLLGNTIATIAPTNGVFTDPCGGTVKRYSIIATYAEPICSGNSVGVITGSTPTGGNGTYNYLWEQSTSVAGTYITVSGTSNAKDYTPGTLTATTYYRRTVTSGAYSDATIVIVPILSGPITAPVITSLCTNTLSVPASTIPGTYVQWFSGSCGGTVLATGTTYNPTAAGTYFARYTNRCASSSCSSFNVASTPPINTVSITPTSPNPICTGTSTASLVYTSTGSPNSYSITWSPNGYLIDIANRSLPNASSGTITLDIPANVLAGTYTGTITVRTSGGCVSASKTFTMQFNKAASIASSSPTLCQNTLMTPITHTTTGTTSIGAPTGLPIGVSASWASNTITISGTPTQSGTFNYSIPLTGSCSGTVNATGTITVNPPSVGGTVSGGTTVCSGTNSTVLTLEGHTGTIVRWESSLDNFATVGSTIANTSTTLTVTNLSATTSYRAVLQSGSCSIVNSSSAAVTVNPPSVGGTVSGGTTVCSGANSTILTLAGHTGAVVRWESSLDNFATAGSAIANIGTTLTATNLSTTTSYRAVLQSGSCSIAISSLATVTVNPPSVGGTVSGGTTVCSGTNSTVLTLAGHIGTITKWQSAVSPFSTWTDIANTAATYTSGSLSATTQFRAVVQSGSCAEVYSVPVAITVNSAPTITPNKVDETCATTNDGSISPTLFGGLTNVRYIKLTQKFVNADAWQQVQEIQALEVFTGSNVALSSTGAIATSSSIYNNDPGTFGPAKVNDGDAVGYSFWHSNSTNINEWVQVDLQSGKNIDYLRIYNRSDCCQNRGQNMLLELFDGANNLVYSRTVNLWENINGPHYIDVNILDLSWTDSATTLNRTGLDSATYILNYADAIGCSLSSPINIGSAIIAIPTQGTITPITCNVPVASVILNNLPSVGTWTLTQSGTATATISGTGSSATISGLAPGTYNFSVSIGGCSSSNLEAVKIDPLQETIWNGGWSNGLPNSDKKLIFTANYNQTIDLVACSCEVKSGNVTVSSGKTMTLTNELKVSGGIMKFENNASLVQINEDSTINSGAITYQRETVTPVDKFDYTYWSSPVSPQTLYNVSPNTLADKYMSFDAVTNNWKVENSITKVMEPGVGYSIRGPQNYYAPNPPNPFPASFIGVPHNGTIEVPITATDASYLLGNPYPSALDADAFLTNNAGVIDGTIYFWTHVTDIAPSGSQYIYNSDDYATYNLTGGVGTDNKEYPKGGVESISGSTKPTGKIASGQGFFATGIAAGNVEFKNAMRVGIGGITGENIQFFRTKNSKSKVTSSTIEKNRVWLNLTNTEGAFKQLLVGYVTGATNEYDTSYDGFSFSLNEYINFYSIVANEAMAIQGRALPFDENDLVPLGYSSAIVGDFSIGIDEVDGAMQSQNVFLEDKMLGVIHNLKEASYNFTTEKGVFNERFVLRYTDKTLGTGDFESEDKTIVVFKEKNELKIKSEFETMKRVTIFDLLGKKVFEETLKDVNEFRTSNITLKNQIVIVKVVLTNGQVVAKKVSY